VQHQQQQQQGQSWGTLAAAVYAQMVYGAATLLTDSEQTDQYKWMGVGVGAAT
jgi:hypothetical protein